MDKKDCIIVDLEGTLSNCFHRIYYWYDKNYDKWNELFSQDSVNEQMVQRIKSHRELNQDIILCTAKSEIYQKEVMTWLVKHDLFYLINCIYYRDADDSRLSVNVKKDMLIKIKKKWNVIKVYDDRPNICRMYINNGIEVHCPSHAIKTPADQLKEAAELFEEKNKEYGSSYKEFGKIMLAYFPDGVVLKTKKDFTRWGMLNIMMSKISRYCNNFTKGGHPDSLNDLSVYSAMLAEIDQLGKD